MQAGEGVMLASPARDAAQDLFQWQAGAAPVVPPAGAQLFLALDYGKKRTGAAVGSRITGGATPCKSIVAQGDARFAGVAALVAAWQPQALVLGIPYYPDGAAHANTRRALAFGRQLAQRFGLPVYGVDERYSTIAALADGARDADAAAACIILEQFLQSLP